MQAPSLENTNINQFHATNTQGILETEHLHTSASGKANDCSHGRPDRELPNMNTLQGHLRHPHDYSKAKSGNLEPSTPEALPSREEGIV